jgi:hypothetical protein
MGGPIGIDGREYKLLLEPAAFAGMRYEKAATTLWERRLKPLIAKELDAKKNGASRADGELKLKKRRVVTFFDTKAHHLARHLFALRKRTFFKDGALTGLPELTLKFRTPDLLLSAEYRDAARHGEGATVLQEDIAPLQISRKGKPAAIARPRSTYSRFSVSTKREIDDAFATLGDVGARFGAFSDFLHESEHDAGEKLRTGPMICEWVFQYARVDLGKSLDAEFGFTLWHFTKPGAKRFPFERAESGGLDPDVVEISFDFETKGGRMDADAAERAATLFKAMQEKLPANRDSTSKTALGLPSGK